MLIVTTVLLYETTDSFTKYLCRFAIVYFISGPYVNLPHHYDDADLTQQCKQTALYGGDLSHLSQSTVFKRVIKIEYQIRLLHTQIHVL